MRTLREIDKKFYSLILSSHNIGDIITLDEGKQIFEQANEFPKTVLTRTMFNRTFKVKQTKQSYKIPTLDQIKDNLDDLNKNSKMPQKQITDESTEQTEEISMAGVVPMSQARGFSNSNHSVQEIDTESLIPTEMGGFVPFGSYRDVKSIIKSKRFYPTFITGLSGNGKTQGIAQACAELKRELIRVNLTIETDEDDLIGHYSLFSGETVWEDGPVVKAMERGAVLLLDEVDLASNRIMCLQPVLEGGNLFLKKAGRIIRPRPGFTVFATANTKGKGDETGQFAGTNILNEAFLERFPVTLEQSYPTVAIEKKILEKELERLLETELSDEETKFAEDLCTWADIVRRTYNDGAIDEVISTRRLVHIVGAYSIFKKTKRAVELCCSRFDEDTKLSFIDLYEKVAGGIDVNQLEDSISEQEGEATSE